MKISLNWLKDFIDIGQMSPAELANALTLATAEVEGIEEFGTLLEQVKVAEVVKVKPHGKTATLSVVTLNTGKETVEVVCGAPNVKAGQKVAFAPVGTCFPEIGEIVSKEIQGMRSEGMLCSEKELSVGEDESGIWELPKNAKVGATIGDFLGLQPDYVIEIDNKSLTHRPDLWGHLGIAREISTILRKPLKEKFGKSWFSKLEGQFESKASPVTLKVDPNSSCLGYYGFSVEGVNVGPSPVWMQARLRAVGLRPVSNLVDIGNYVMLELGIPMHMFDRDRIKGSKISVYPLTKSAILDILDGSRAELQPGDTVVADEGGPLVVAGIIGGVGSGISDNTKNLFVEVANWRPAAVRKTSIRIGVRTDSSLRYEKALDSLLLKRTSLRAAELVLELCPGSRIVGKLEYDGPKLSTELASTTTAISHISKALGKQVSGPEVREILGFLGFEVNGGDENLKITIPSYRHTKDVSCEADIVEEVGRVIGFNSITPQAPVNMVKAVRPPNTTLTHRRIKDFLVLSGRLLEIRTYPLLGLGLLERVGWPDKNDALTLANSWSPEFDRMRPSMIPHLLEALDLNQKTYDRFGLFEIGRRYTPSAEKFSVESYNLTVGLFDRKESPLVKAISTVENLLSCLGLSTCELKGGGFDSDLIPPAWSGVNRKQCQYIIREKKVIGAVFEISTALLRSLKIRGHVAAAILDISTFEDQPMIDNRRFEAIPKFPFSVFDCTVVVPARVEAGRIIESVKHLGIPEIQSVKIADVFNLKDGQRAVTLRAQMGNPNKTLEGVAIKAMSDNIVKKLAEDGFPLKTS